MKSFFKFLFANKWLIVISLVASFLLGSTITYVYDYYNGYYQITFQVSNYNLFKEKKDILFSSSYLNEIKNSGYNEKTNTNKYENIDVDEMLNKKGFSLIEKEDNSFVIETSYRYYDVFFIMSSRKISTRAKMFVKDSLVKLDKDINIIFDNPNEIIETKNIHNKWIIGLYFMIIGFVAVLSYLLIKYFKNKNNSLYQEKYIIRSEVSSLKNAQSITTLAMLFAMMIACKFIPVPSGFGNLGISFVYLFFALIGMLYGPLTTFGIGILSDVIGFMIKGTGYFFLGYTLQAALSGAIYGFCFYKKNITFGKVLLARFLINIFMNAIFGSFLYTIVMTEFKLFSQDFISVTMSYMILLSLPKNIVYLLPQSLLLFGFIKVSCPILYRLHYLKKTLKNSDSIVNNVN